MGATSRWHLQYAFPFGSAWQPQPSLQRTVAHTFAAVECTSMVSRGRTQWRLFFVTSTSHTRPPPHRTPSQLTARSWL
jgi:hypothetical protein